MLELNGMSGRSRQCYEEEESNRECLFIRSAGIYMIYRIYKITKVQGFSSAQFMYYFFYFL